MSTPETRPLEPYVTIYDTQIPDGIAERLSVIFERNYPKSHSDEEKAKDSTARRGKVAIQALVEEGRTLHVAFTEDGEPAGFLEEQTIPVEDGVFEQLVWIIVGKRKIGLASLLYQSFMREANKRAKDRQEPTRALLNVHKDNEEAKNIYLHWGWKPDTENSPKDPNKLFMIMDLPKNDIRLSD